MRGDCFCTVSDALKLAIFLAYEIAALWTDPKFSASIREQLQYGNVRSGAMEAKETGLKLKPSKRIRPLSVPIQRYPSAVCAMSLTAPPGNLLRSSIPRGRTAKADG